MRGAAFVLTAGAVAAACYTGLPQLEALVLPRLFGLACEPTLFTLSCDYAPDGGFEHRTFAVLWASFGLALAATQIFTRRTVAYPFLITLCLLAMFALGFDTLLGRPVIHGAKIINDTMNVLSFVILASFLLTFLMARNEGLSLVRVIAAVASSYSVKVLAVVAFAALHPQLMGATELYFLYVIYAFGVFTIHIMTVSGLLMSLGPVKPAPPREAQA
ncbi:hypothetical protein [Phenylobacterium sp.]|jgi:hypothetical protein|uniref:hypothetical protein n=1 Tax=Phenylobacterium sp. TaxID=1871053 RepID=UPI002E37324A|nr:hypothetical protein [Phenylobacterium sp.]HEX2560227.1 hypothetical protein [Phenylobacterium sp.]